MESTRVIMLRNWHFDILNREHWKIAWDLWSTTWVISEPKEWAFVLIVVSFIPLWFTGWIALSLISWGKFIKFVVTLPWRIIKNIFYQPAKVIVPTTEITPVTKRPSYKEIRPKSIRPVQPYVNQPVAAPQNFSVASPAPQPVAVPATPIANSTVAATPATFDHPLFSFNETEDTDDFDIDSFDISPHKNKTPEKRYEEQEDVDEEEYEEPARPTYVPYKNKQDNRRHDDNDRYSRVREDNSYSRNNRNDGNSYSRNNRNDDNSYSRNNRNDDNSYSRNNRSYNKNNREQGRSYVPKMVDSCADVIKEKGFALFSRLTIKNTIIDHLAISANRIYLCMLDRETGDWLADEERFNDEEPLWFSENSHRISPVRKLEIAKQIIENRLTEAELDYTVEPILVEQMGNIINAEDMFEIWDSMNIKVCRIDRGMPKELPPFSRTLPEAGKTISSGRLDKLINIIRNIG